MSAPPWFAWYPRDHLADTTHLSRDEDGGYRLLIDACWMREGKLPDDDAQLARITKCETIDEWRMLRKSIAPFFRISGGFWHQKRLTVEMRKVQRLHNARSLGARLTNAKRSAGRSVRARTREQEQEQEQEESSLRSLISSNEEISPRAAGKVFWKRAKKLVGNAGAVGQQLRKVGRDKVNAALDVVERVQPDDPVAFFIACCQDRVNGRADAKDPPQHTGPKEPLTEEARQRILAKMRGDPHEASQAQRLPDR